jgi:hypothetical protein
MATQRKQRMPPWNRNLLIWLVALAAVITLLYFLAPGLFRPSESDYSSHFARSVASQGFVYYGDTRTKVYYPFDSAKAKQIPEKYLVKFKDEAAAQKYGFRRGRS